MTDSRDREKRRVKGAEKGVRKTAPILRLRGSGNRGEIAELPGDQPQ